MYCARSPNVLAGLPNILYIIEQLSVCMCVCVCVSVCPEKAENTKRGQILHEVVNKSGKGHC